MGDSRDGGAIGAGAAAAKRRARPCPICNGLSLKAYHPFCSKRCADVDLHRWFSGSYRIPVVEEAPEEGGNDGGEDAGGR